MYFSNPFSFLVHLTLEFCSFFFPVIYTIEFQKRGLPHAHIIIFLSPEDKILTSEDVDRIISAEIPDEEEDPSLYKVVKNFMVHGPCGAANPKSPCMDNGRCTKHFPKKFVDHTTIDDEGFPIYRHRNNGRTIEKNHIQLDNRYIVPYNPELLRRYEAHINVESCNQGTSIKYLFKYVNKGYDRVTASISQAEQQGQQTGVVDEIKSYYDCRYISACEACWRIFSYDIHYRKPPVERLKFHLPGEQFVVVKNDGSIEEAVNREVARDTMFTAWMKKNKEDPDARKLTYMDFPLEYVFKEDIRQWVKRKRGFSIGRINFVPPSAGELYYLRILLNKVRGATCYEDIRTVNGILYDTFKEACYALGLLDDDKEYIAAIKEASSWGSGQYLRKLFCTMLFCNCLSRPEFVWKETWPFICEDVLYMKRRELQIEGIFYYNLHLHL